MSKGKGNKNRIKRKRFNFFNRRNRYHHYEPFYDEHADYNTNAKSYYDYLARFNRFIRVIEDFINRLLNRNIEFDETESVKFTKDGDWIDNGECEPNHYDDIINISADVKISNDVETIELLNTEEKTVDVPNGSEVKNDGVWSPDYINALNQFDNSIGDLQEDIENINNEISNIKNDISNLTGGLQKIVDNLYQSGAITTNNINNFDFKNNRNIATGNINLFGGTSDGNSFIRTSDNQTENDLTGGY